MTERNGWLKDILWVLALAGVVAIVFRLWFGLGATTNLSDAVPWGLWKILNMVAGVALATGGFTVGFLVYVLKTRALPAAGQARHPGRLSRLRLVRASRCSSTSACRTASGTRS